MVDQKLLDTINKFLEDKTFTVVDPLNIGLDNFPVDIKVKITGTRNYTVVGEKKPVIEFELYVVGPQKQSDIMKSFFTDETGEVKIDTRSAFLPFLKYKTEELLKNFLNYFGIKEGVICTKMINKIPEKISESLIREDRYDFLVRKVVRDITTTFKNHDEGSFDLPSDIREDDFAYSISDDTEFNVELEIIKSQNVDGFQIESSYYREEDTMEIKIIYNPQYGKTIIYDIIGDLNDDVRHEMQHAIQQSQGVRFPKSEPKTPLKYYSQPIEIDAQKRGFRRLAKLQRKPLEQVVRTWFNVNRDRHRLSDKEMEVVIDKILK